MALTIAFDRVANIFLGDEPPAVPAIPRGAASQFRDGMAAKVTTVKLAPVILMFAGLMLSGCAQTVLYDRRTGKAIARFQGDMIGSHYVDGGTVWDVQQVSHSAATLAQGAAASNVIGSIGTSAAGVMLSAGSSGLFGKAAGVAVPAVANMFQPRPAAMQAH